MHLQNHATLQNNQIHKWNYHSFKGISPVIPGDTTVISQEDFDLYTCFFYFSNLSQFLADKQQKTN